MSIQEGPFRVLVVDDLEDNRNLLIRRLERKGHVVSEAPDGASALEAIAKNEFDLVLLDIMMPGLNGLEVLREIRLVHSADNLPVIMVTARAATSDIVQALRIGANDYVTKPIDFSAAFARIQTQLDRKRTRMALDASLRELELANQRLKLEIEERQRSDNLVAHLKHHDALTSLANRSQIREQLSRELNALTRRNGAIAVVLFDLDGFRSINGALGDRYGDQLLIGVAQRLRLSVRGLDHVGRIGGDEFCVVSTVEGPQDAIQLANRLSSAVCEPYTINGQRVSISVCLGITLAPDDGIDPDFLLDNAQLALARARLEGRGRCCFFEVGMDARAKARRLLELDLRAALIAGEFEIHYQPLLNLSSGKITGAEALLRWNHRHRGWISPADFIPLAEETGLVGDLGSWVLHQACQEAADWPQDLTIAVNISAVQCRRPGLAETISSALERSGLAAERLELEITETALLTEESTTVELLHQIRRLGVRISLDDFGTGYSSLSYLRAFPFEKIKIDRSFVQEIGVTKNTSMIVKALIDLSAALEANINAEGVETEAQLEWLKAAGCSEVQGYLISRPLPRAAFRSFACADEVIQVA